MCTLVVIATADGLRIGANRDELRTRAPAESPRLQHVAGVAVLAPRDLDAGGTWIAVNAHGLVVAILNRFDRFDPSLALRSRGLLPLDLGDARDAVTATDRLLASLDTLRRTRPFELVAVAPGAPALVAAWNGTDLDLRGLQPPFVRTSSVFQPGETRADRAAELPMLLEDSSPEAMHRWFARHTTGRSPRAVCIHHPLAQTVSHTQIDVTPAEVRMRYHPTSPCQPATTVELRLARAAG